MNLFAEYLSGLEAAEKACLEQVISIIHREAPEATDGLAYGLPAFRYKDRPLVGFSANTHGLNLYPYDPRIVSEVIRQFPDLKHDKGVIRFSPDAPLPEQAIVLIVALRRSHLDS